VKNWNAITIYPLVPIQSIDFTENFTSIDVTGYNISAMSIDRYHG